MPLSPAPAPSATRGDIIIQPSFFTSSLYVNPLRDDILHLIETFHQQYVETRPARPFALFKTIWQSLGWQWMHFKVFDTRTRETFLSVTLRLFLERMVETEPPINRVVALFGLYTFFNTQPSSSAPPLHSVHHIPIPIDVYTSLVDFPNILTTETLSPLQPSVIYVLSTLMKARVFYILPASNLSPFNPRELPRELFVQDPVLPESQSDGPAPKKKGRPSKRDKLKKAKDALGNLDKWLDRNTFIPQIPPPGYMTMPGPPPVAQHVLLSHPPIMSHYNYQVHKSHLLNALDPLYPNPHAPTDTSDGRAALERANHHVLNRLKKIDRLAAEQGLEVGGEGGDRTGLERVERAVGELGKTGPLGRRGGILGLLEGGGMEDARILVDVDADMEAS